MNLVRFQKPAYMYNVNSLLNDLMKDFSTEESTCKATNPMVNVTDEEKKYILEFLVPGFEKENIEVKNADGILSVKGKVSKPNSETKNWTRKEYCISDFERKFTLPDNVEPDLISAKYLNGVLIIEIPKKEAKPSEGAFDIQVN